MSLRFRPARSRETSGTPPRRYSDATAQRVVSAYRDLERIEDVVTISAIARRTGISRPTVRAVLQQECGWTPAQSCKAHRAGVRRGKLLQAVTGHPGLARGRATLEVNGWPNLERAQRTLEATGYGALDRGRATQASRGWPGLIAGLTTQASTGYSHLAKGRANLAVRGWPNWKKAHALLAAQDYFPVLDAQRRRAHTRPVPETDRRLRRGRNTRLAVVEALQALQIGPPPEEVSSTGGRHRRASRVTGREIATYLHLHPTTVCTHLRQLRALGIIE